MCRLLDTLDFTSFLAQELGGNRHFSLSTSLTTMAERLNVSNQSKREQFDWFSECQRLMLHTVEKYTYRKWIKIEKRQEKDFYD